MSGSDDRPSSRFLRLAGISAVLLAAASCGGGGGGDFSSAALVVLRTTSVPDGVTGQEYVAQFEAHFPHPPGRFLVVAGALPDGLELDPETGLLSGYPRATGRFVFEVAARDGLDPSIPGQRDATFAQDVGRFVVDMDLGPPNFVPQVVAPAQYRAAYSYTLDVAGGIRPYTFSLTGGTLPAGVGLDPSGLLSGFPTQANPQQGVPFTFQATVTDYLGSTDVETFELQVIVRPLLILTSQVPQAAQGFPYDVQLELASAGAGDPILWAQRYPLAPGEVDLASFGMELTSAGRLRNQSGVPGPTSLGSHPFSVVVYDEAGQTATRSYDLVVNPGPVLTSISPKRASAGGPFTATGLNFQPGAQLVFKPGPTQTVITPTFVNSTTLTFATAPPAPGGGTVAVRVVNPDTGFFTLANAFVFPAATLSFGTKGFISSAVSTTGLDAADVDGDGRAEVLHCGAAGFRNYSQAGGVTSSAGGLHLHRNNGGVPVTFTTTSLDAGNFYGAQFVDLNVDGRLDVVALQATSVRTWLNGMSGPPGTFTPGPTSSIPSGFPYPQSMTIGFLDTDAVPDLLFCVSTTSFPSGAVHSLRGNGSGGFTPLDSATSTITDTRGVVSITCLDLNGDGRQDTVAGHGFRDNFVGSTVHFTSISQANGTFGPWNPGGTTNLGWADTTCVAAGDFNGDGQPAFMLCHNQDAADGGGRQLSLFSGASLGQQNLTAPSTAPKSVAPVDGDFDAKMDFAVSTAASGLIVYRGSTLTAVQTLDVNAGSPTVTSARTGRIASADLDGDGKNDLLVGTSYWASDIQPEYYGATYAMNIAGDGGTMGVVFYLNSSN